MSATIEIPEQVIVSRHPGAIAWLRQQVPALADARVLSDSIGPEDVRGRWVYGNLPLHLAAVCSRVYAIEFHDQPPRGRDYTVEEMDAAGARIALYRIIAGDELGRRRVG